MSKRKNQKQLRITGELAARIKKIADANGASDQLIGNLAITAGLPMVETKFDELKKVAA